MPLEKGHFYRTFFKAAGLPPSVEEDVYDDGYLRVEHRNVYVTCAGEPLRNLTRKEFFLLSRLVRGEGRPVAHSELWEYGWGEGAEFNRRTFRVCVSNLRHKLEPYGIEIISQVHFGYRIARKSDERTEETVDV